MNARETWADAEVLSRFAAELEGGGADDARAFAPTWDEAMGASALPGRLPGDGTAIDVHSEGSTPPGPRSIILDCGTSRTDGYTHVLWIAPSAEAVLGSEGFARLGEIVGRVYGVTGYHWESIDRLHVAAGEIAWDDLLAESREALAVYMAGRA